jgi:hypothetical protein
MQSRANSWFAYRFFPRRFRIFASRNREAMDDSHYRRHYGIRIV